jgi:hypothetical protein
VGGVALLLVATVAIVLLAGNRPPQTYPAGSPEAALQAYLQAWEARDLDRAWEFFSTSARGSVTLDEYRRQARDYPDMAGAGGPSRRVFIDQTTVTGDRAELQLTIEETYIQGLGVGRNRYSQRLAMVRESGQWRLDQLIMGIQPGWPIKEAPMAEPG